MSPRPFCSWMIHDSFGPNPRSSRSDHCNFGFSLLEVVLATAVLAGSAMVLVSMISMGSKYGQVAQQRVQALAAASSIADQLLVENRLEKSASEITGVVGPAGSPMGYRVKLQPFNLSQHGNENEPLDLQQMTIEIFPGEISATSTNQKALCSLTRLVRSRDQSNESRDGTTDRQEYPVPR